MVRLEICGRDIAYAKMAPLKRSDGEEQVVSCATGCWGDAFGEDLSSLLSVPPPPPTQRPRRVTSVAELWAASSRRVRCEETSVQEEEDSEGSSGTRGGGSSEESSAKGGGASEGSASLALKNRKEGKASRSARGLRLR